MLFLNSWRFSIRLLPAEDVSLRNIFQIQPIVVNFAHWHSKDPDVEAKKMMVTKKCSNFGMLLIALQWNLQRLIKSGRECHALAMHRLDCHQICFYENGFHAGWKIHRILSNFQIHHGVLDFLTSQVACGNFRLKHSIRTYGTSNNQERRNAMNRLRA